MATIAGLAAARHRAAAADGWDARADGLAGRPPLSVYVSAEGHSCVRKAAELLGIGTRGVRVVGVDGQFRMDTEALRAALAEDRAAGWRPFAIAATAGTVNSGAIDPLADLADIAAEHGLWLHVDGAYGAVGVLEPALAPWFAGLDRADSLALDPHKWLGVPVDCGGLLVREPSALREAFSLVPPYLKDDHADGPQAVRAGSPSTARSRPARSAPCGPGPPWPTSAGPGPRPWSAAPWPWRRNSGAWSIRPPTWSGPRRWSPRSSRSGAARRA